MYLPKEGFLLSVLTKSRFFMDPLIQQLSDKAIDLSGESKKELERTCWMIVHEHKHGVMPTEYDIREIDEELYLEVLKTARDMA